MEEKIRLLREKIIKELSVLDDGVHIVLDYDPTLVEMIVFDINKKNNSKRFGLPKTALKHIDFTNISFDSFDAHEVDFTGLYGVKINPETIYKKDLSNSILNGVTFKGLFDEAIISQADFTGSKNAVIDVSKLHAEFDVYNFRSGIYIYKIFLYKCKFSNVTFIGDISEYKFFQGGEKSYKKIVLEKADFTGSKGAIIRPDHINFYDVTLKDATIIGDFTKCRCMTGTNFKGAKSGNIFGHKIKINPKNRDLRKCVFDGVKFTGPFTKSNITGANFEGSSNAVIDLREIDPETIIETINFSDTRVIGHAGKEMQVSEDGRFGKNIEAMVDKLLGTEAETSILDKEKLERARKELVLIRRKKVQEKIDELLRLVESSEKLGVDPKNLYCSIPIEKDTLLVEIDGHYEINRNFIESLRFLNLSMIDFTNVKVSGIDFRHSGARINPQTVYKKDLSNGVFDAGNIKFFDDFTRVNIEGADFSECEVDPKEKIK